MKFENIRKFRLQNQHISHTTFTTPEDVVSWMGGMQAQDYLGSLWAIALRTKNCSEKDVEKAIAQRKIVRTWPMRRTLHFAAAADVHWMVRLTSERVIKTYSAHLPQLGLTEELITKARTIVVKALSGGKPMTREAIYVLFEAAHIPTDQSRGIHILWRLGQEAVVCFGPREGKQQTFVLLDDWVPEKKVVSREEAIGKLTLRYFTSHGPATVYDFAWWSGLTISDVKNGIASVRTRLHEEIIDGKTYWMGNTKLLPEEVDNAYLLPPFDEYIVSYKDRSAVLKTEHNNFVNRGGNGIFAPVVVIDGRVVGNWKRELHKNSVQISTLPFEKFRKFDPKLISLATERYGKFLNLPVETSSA